MLDGPYGFGAEGYLLLLVLAPVAAAIVGRWLGWRRDARASFGGLPRETRSRRILTVAARMAEVFGRERGVTVVAPPLEMPGFTLAAWWHEGRITTLRIGICASGWRRSPYDAR